MASDLIGILKRITPLLIIAYVAALAALRLSFSEFLEVDEAQFVGAVDFRLVYENSHPPLYNWLVRLALEATDWNWAQSVAIVKYTLLAGYYLLIWKIARRLVDERAAVVAIAAAALLPQIIWMSAHTLAHSIMVMVGVAATAHAMLLALQEPSVRSFAWLGVAAAIGALAKYNFLLFALPFLAVVLLSDEMRARVWRREALVAVGIFTALVSPTLVAAAIQLGTTTERLDKLYAADADLAWFDLPFLGIDGMVSLVAAALAWAGPAVIVWSAARFFDARAGGTAETDNLFANAIGRTIAVSMILFAAIVLLGDIHRVHERYLTPMLATLPIYLAIAWPLSRSALVVAPLSAILAVAALIGFWAMVEYGRHRYVFPYERIAAQIGRGFEAMPPIFAERQVDRANLVLALNVEGARTPTYAPIEDEVVLVWRGRRDIPDWLIPQGFGAADKITTFVAPTLNGRGDPLVYRFQLFERVGGDVSSAAPGSE